MDKQRVGQASQAQAPTIALLGSFRQFLEQVTTVSGLFHEAGVTVTSPRDLTVNEPGIDFVRFPSDDTSHDDATVQTIAMHRIVGADAAYVVAPSGYIGRTTCYEVGRLIQLDRPLYFSEMPKDLPVHVPPQSVVAPETLIAIVRAGTARHWSSWTGHANYELEQALLRGRPDRTL